MNMGKFSILKNRIVLILLLSIIVLNSSLTKSLVNGISSIVDNDHDGLNLNDDSTDIFVPTNPMLAIDSEENLYLVYRENYKDYSSIVLLRTIEDNDYFVWNLTRTYLYRPNETDIINSYPTMVFHQDKFYLGITSRNDTISYFKILEIDPSNLVTTTLLELNSTTSYFLKPKIAINNQAIWISWLDNVEGNYNLYYTKYNQTTTSFSSIEQLSNNTYGNCQNSEVYLDHNGNCHFVWSQGRDYKNHLLYKYYLENETCQMTSIVVGNTTYAIDPDVIVESNGQVNIFWSNYTVIGPIMLGTINIHYCTFSEANNWSKIEYIAPYRTVDKTELTNGENPDVVIDSNSILWMIYELVEPYPQITGISIRGKQNGYWLDGEHVTMGITPAYDPCVVSDNSGSIHMVWLDFRLAYFEIFYRARFDTGILSQEQQLTKYYAPAMKERSPYLFAVFFGTIVVIAVIFPLTAYYFKNKRLKKLIAEHKKEIEND
ncbi:MAG: hypothetical protein ACTSQN_18065 [Candidatus Heimdallarchaeota archaeon]